MAFSKFTIFKNVQTILKLAIFGAEFWFSKLKNSRNLLIFQFGQFQKFLISKIIKISDLENLKNCRFDKFEKILIWKIRKICNFDYSENFKFRKFQKFPKFYNMENYKNFQIYELIYFACSNNLSKRKNKIKISKIKDRITRLPSL